MMFDKSVLMITNEAVVKKETGHLILDHRFHKFAHGGGQGYRAIVVGINWITLFKDRSYVGC
jgi:hypothetical protein